MEPEDGLRYPPQTGSTFPVGYVGEGETASLPCCTSKEPLVFRYTTSMRGLEDGATCTGPREPPYTRGAAVKLCHQTPARTKTCMLGPLVFWLASNQRAGVSHARKRFRLDNSERLLAGGAEPEENSSVS